MTSLNLENFIGNIYLPGIDNVFLRKKIGKDKFSAHNAMTPLLVFDSNIILSDLGEHFSPQVANVFDAYNDQKFYKRNI